MARPVLIRRNASNVTVLSHWNRRAWQEIAILKARIEELETRVDTTTGGNYEYSPEGDPWDTETVTNKIAVGWAFIGGFVLASILWIVILWG